MAELISHKEAREILQRFVHAAFDRGGERPRLSIPANPMDDDLRLSDYIDQQGGLKSIGMLSRTADGFLLGDNVCVYGPSPVPGDNRILTYMLFGGQVSDGDRLHQKIGLCYSTKEAAEKAAASPRPEPSEEPTKGGELSVGAEPPTATGDHPKGVKEREFDTQNCFNHKEICNGNLDQ